MLVVEAVLPVILEQFCTFVTTESQLVSGVGRDVEWLREELQSMNSLLRAASSYTDEKKYDPNWIDKIRDVIHEAEDVTETFDLLGSRPHRFYSISHLIAQVKIRYHVALNIKNIRTSLADISRRKRQYEIGEAVGAGDDDSSNSFVKHLSSSPFVGDGILVGAEEHLKLIKSQTLEIAEDLSVIAIWGMGGVGKTTIVKYIYNDTHVKKQFDRTAWIYVSQSVTNRQILLRMLNGLMEVPTAEALKFDVMSLQETLITGLQEKRYLLVLDDMWNPKLWDVVNHTLPKGKCGSKVIITTRNLEVASHLATATSGIHEIHPLSHEQSWKLFCMKAFGTREPPEELKECEKQVVGRCAGLPLAVITLGEMMARKDRNQTEWKHVLDEIPMSLCSIDESIMHVLFLSYKDLSYPLKQCFLYLAAFPPDFEFSRKRLIHLLMVEGFINQEQEKSQPLEDVAERYLMDLISRNMLQVSTRSTSGRVKGCRVHDLLHQLAISLSEKEKLITIYRNEDTLIQENARRISIQNEITKKFKIHQLRSLLVFKTGDLYHFIHHLFKSNRMLRVLDLQETGIRKLPPDIGSTLIHLRYLNVKGTQMDTLPKSVENLFKLQTLDIRRTRIRKISLIMSGLKQLRHFQMGDVDQTIAVSTGLQCLTKLQVLTGIQATESIVKEIASMSQLRKLIIEVKQAAMLTILCPSLCNMKALLSLSIICKEFKQMDLTTMSPPPLLQKLHLAGYLEKLPGWIINTHNLVKLRLGFLQLRDDPMPILGVLPKLVFLQLYETYQGKIMRCTNNGFFKLKILILTQLNQLELWEIEEGALSSIQEVWIMSCTNLNMIPSGFRFLRSMIKLRVVQMPNNFQKRFKTQEGEDFPKVQHIPIIQVLD